MKKGTTTKLSINELSRITGLDRRTIRKRVPAAKGKLKPAAVLKLLQHVAGSIDAKRQLEIERLRLICEALKFENERERGLWMLKSESDQDLQKLAAHIQNVLRSRLENELPPQLEGLRAPEIAVKMREVRGEIIDAMRALPSEEK